MGLILKLACYVLAALLFYQLVQTAFRINPLARVKIPALPTLDSETNSPAGAPSTASGRTNATSAATNAMVTKTPKDSGTNLATAVAGKSPATNTVATVTNSQTEKAVVLEDVQRGPKDLKVPVKIEMAGSNSASISPPTNIIAGVALMPSNLPPGVTLTGTNLSLPVAAAGTNASGTNASAKAKPPKSPSSGPDVATMNMNAAMMRGGGGGKSDLPPEIKARVDRIYESELFGQVMRPQPMALQGIAGNSAFLRTPSGQTGLVKEGDSLGEIKLLRIGINRVLVEQDGQKSELTIFNGYGGESLMPKDKETSK